MTAIKRINPTLSEEAGWDRYLADVRGLLHSHGNWKLLSEESGVSGQTISKLAYGETKSPHSRTVFRLMDALGRKKSMLRAVDSGAPVTEEDANNFRPKRRQHRKTALRLREELRARIHPHRTRRRREAA